MCAKNLERLPFFALAGAIGVDRQSPMGGARALRASAALLDRPGRLLWVFAQGRERASTTSPLGFEAGAAGLATLAPDARVLPLSIRYELGAEPLPVLMIDFGAPLPAETDTAAAVRAQEHAVERLLARSAAALEHEDFSAYETWSRTEASRMQAVLERALAALTRPWARLTRDAYSSRS